MTRAAAVSFAILLGSAALAAQTSQTQTTPQSGFAVAAMESTGPNHFKTIVVQLPPQASCPINLTARHAPGADRIEVNGVQIGAAAQKLHLLVSPSSKRVIAASVTIHGFPNKVRAVQTMTTPDSSDATKTFDVRFPAGPEEMATDLVVPGFSGETAIDLNSVTYADGSTWKLAAGSTCSSRIDPIMLVNSH